MVAKAPTLLLILALLALSRANHGHDEKYDRDEEVRLEYDVRIAGSSAAVVGSNFECADDCESLYVRKCVRRCDGCPNSCETLLYCKDDGDRGCYERIANGLDIEKKDDDLCGKDEKELEKLFEHKFNRIYEHSIWNKCEERCIGSSKPGRSCQAHCRRDLRHVAERKFIKEWKDMYGEDCHRWDEERVKYRRKEDRKLRYDLDFTSEIGAALLVNSDVDVEGKFKFQIVIDRIVEYRPDDVGGFQLRGNDEVVNVYGRGLAELSAEANYVLERAWDFGELETLNEATNSSERRVIRASTKDGIFTMLFYVNPDPQLLENGVEVDINDLKFDFAFDIGKLRERGWFADDDTELAIVASIKSEMKHRICLDSPRAGSLCLEREEELTGEITLGGRLGWVNQITCDKGPNADLAIGWATLEDVPLDCDENDQHCKPNDSHASSLAWSLNVSKANGLCLWDPVVKAHAVGTANPASIAVLNGALALISALIMLVVAV